ncbi:MAG: hypothetical protein RR623_06700 [Bacilli bacterium]
MKIAAMGYYPDYNHKDFYNIDFSDSRTLLEFDMVIVNYDYLLEEYSKSDLYNGVATLTESSSVKVIKDINRRKKEFEELLESGRNILVISPKKDFVYRYTGKTSTSGTGRNSRTTNYVETVSLIESLPTKINTIEATGNSMFVANNNIKKLFDTYKDNLEYYSYLDEETDNALLKIKNTKKVVSWYEKIGNGILLFFPNQQFEDIEKTNGSKKEKQFLKDIFEYMNSLKSDKKDLPLWAKKYQLSEEIEKYDNIQKIEKDIDLLEKKLKKEQIALSNMEEIKYLFTSEDLLLEEHVRAIFEKMGFNIIKASGNEEDIVIGYEDSIFIVEVKGTDSSSNEKHSSQAIKWRENYFIENDIRGKGVLVVNAFKNRELEDRQDTFPKQMIKYAEYQELCMISSIQLFNIYKEFEKKNISTKEIADSILSTKGIYEGYNQWDLYISKVEINEK